MSLTWRRSRITGAGLVAAQYDLTLERQTIMDNILFIPGLAVSEITKLVRSQRVDFVGIGDSNLIFQGHGYDEGFQAALTQQGVPMWATGLISQNENNGTGSGQGHLYQRQAGGIIGASSGAPASLDDLLNKGTGGLFPAFYTHLADAATFSSGNLNGLNAEGTCPINTAGDLAFDVHNGTFDSGSGQFRPIIRRNSDPFNVFADGGIITTNTGSIGIRTTTVTLAANSARNGLPIAGLLTRPGFTGITGPFFLTYMRFRNTARATGYSFGSLSFRGGQSTRTHANDFQQASDATLTHYFGILRENQGAEKKIVIFINSGLNDRNEILASLGPDAVATGNSPEAFVDNHKAIVLRIKEIWTNNSWPEDELVWLLVPSHPIAAPDDTQLVGYRAALREYAKTLPNALFADLDQLVGSNAMVANGWYANSVSDRNHLTSAGYTGLARVIINNAKKPT